MRRLASPSIAALLGLLTLVLLALDIPLESQIHTLSGSNALELILVAPFTAVGIVVARRDPRNALGWLLIAIPLSFVLSSVGSDYAVFVYHFGHRSWPLGPLAVLLDSFGVVAGLLLLPLVILLFPDGRVGGRWRWPLRLGGVVYAVFLVSHGAIAVVALGRRVPVWYGGGVIGANHPTGAAAWTSVTQPITVALFAVLAIASIARQVVIYRCSAGVQRQQLKCLGIGGAATVASLMLAGVSNSAPTWVWAFIILGFAAVPLSIGVGILRYRLFEIDRLISRSLSYALLTALLAGTFIGLVALSTNTLALSGRVGVAASTLVAAALFNPLRLRIQRLVDRRFNRAHYDAEATVAAFTARLRDAVEIDAIRTDLLDAVNRAVQPTQASVWIKP
ncbi:MAG: hypothetical protein ABR946_03935 [Solirubrobacteraceae bacterium]|jgi:hypothetical protein